MQGLLGLLGRDVDWVIPGPAPWSGEGRGHDFTHWLTLADGKVTAHREYADTEAIAKAFQARA